MSSFERRQWKRLAAGLKSAAKMAIDKVHANIHMFSMTDILTYQVMPLTMPVKSVTCTVGTFLVKRLGSCFHSMVVFTRSLAEIGSLYAFVGGDLTNWVGVRLPLDPHV